MSMLVEADSHSTAVGVKRIQDRSLEAIAGTNAVLAGLLEPTDDDGALTLLLEDLVEKGQAAIVVVVGNQDVVGVDGVEGEIFHW